MMAGSMLWNRITKKWRPPKAESSLLDARIVAGVMVATLILWTIRQRRRRRRRSTVLEHDSDEVLKQRVAEAAWSRSRALNKNPKGQIKRSLQNKTGATPLSAPNGGDQKVVANTRKVESPKVQGEGRENSNDLSRPPENDADQETPTIRRATIGDQVAWNEERASREQFGGFSIYGHAPPPNADGCCSLVNNGDSNSSNAVLSPTGFDAIQGVSEMSALPGSDQARNLLQQLCREFEPVVRARGWTVGNVVELCCCSRETKPPNVMGFCATNGDGRTARSIHIRLRPPGSCQRSFSSFYPYNDSLVETMAHELAHIQVQAHNNAFYKLMGDLQDERIQFLANGSSPNATNNPFSSLSASSGRRLGTGSASAASRPSARTAIGSQDLKRLAANAAAQRLNSSNKKQKRGTKKDE